MKKIIVSFAHKIKGNFSKLGGKFGRGREKTILAYEYEGLYVFMALKREI